MAFCAPARVLVVAAVLAASVSGLAAGPEFQVNTYTTDYQWFSSVASDAAGNFVVIWESSGQDGSGWGIFGQRYDSVGTAQGAEFQVNTYTVGFQGSNVFSLRPGVAMDADGDFVVVWNSFAQDGDRFGVFGQRFDSTGALQGAEFLVNTYTTSDQNGPAVAMNDAGNFVVVWTSFGQDGDGLGVFGQRFDAAGVPQDLEFQVDTDTVGDSFRSSVGMDAAGNFVVAWCDDATGDLRAARFKKSGGAAAATFQVTSGSGDYPSVSLDADGDFVVAWEERVGPINDFGIFARRYDKNVVPQGPTFPVNTYTVWNKRRPAVSLDADGDFVVVWTSYYQEGSYGALPSWGTFARLYDSAGTAQDTEFQVNTHTTGDQRFPGVTADADGDFVVTWTSPHDGSDFGVFARCYSQGPCTGLAVTAPLAVTACERRSATFDVVPSSGGVPLPPTSGVVTTIDLVDGGNRAGTEQSILTLDPVGLADAGDYDAVITDACPTPQSVTSTAATLTVTPHPDPVGATLGLSTDGVNLTFTWTDTAAGDYVVHEDTAPDGPFAGETGTAASGTPGLTVPLPAGITYYRVAGRTAGCEGDLADCGNGVQEGGESCD